MSSENKSSADVGDVFCSCLARGEDRYKDISEAHLITVTRGETPGGSECTDYTARCGILGFEYYFGPFRNVYFKTLEAALEKGATLCPVCYPELQPQAQECPECKQKTMSFAYRFIPLKIPRADVFGVVESNIEIKYSCPCGYKEELEKPITSW